MMDFEKRILITGGHSETASSAKKLLLANGYRNIASPDRREMDLTDLTRVKKFLHTWRPDYILHVAGRTTTSKESSDIPWDIFRENLLIEYHMFEAAMEAGVRKTVWLSSDSAFPYSEKGDIQREEELFRGPLKKQIEPYAFAKLAGIKMCEYLNQQCGGQFFISIIPCYIYGKAKKGLLYELVKDFVNAKREKRDEVRVWGSGGVQYRFIHSQDVASAMLFAMQRRMKYSEYVVAPDDPVTKAELAEQIADCVGYIGKIVFDEMVSVPSNASPARLREEGWKAAVPLRLGIKELVEEIIEEVK